MTSDDSYGEAFVWIWLPGEVEPVSPGVHFDAPVPFSSPDLVAFEVFDIRFSARIYIIRGKGGRHKQDYRQKRRYRLGAPRFHAVQLLTGRFAAQRRGTGYLPEKCFSGRRPPIFP